MRQRTFLPRRLFFPTALMGAVVLPICMLSSRGDTPDPTPGSGGPVVQASPLPTASATPASGKQSPAPAVIDTKPDPKFQRPPTEDHADSIRPEPGRTKPSPSPTASATPSPSPSAAASR